MISPRPRSNFLQENKCESLSLHMPGFISVESNLLDFFHKINIGAKDLCSMNVNLTTCAISKKGGVIGEKSISKKFTCHLASRADFLQRVVRELNLSLHMEMLNQNSKSRLAYFSFDYTDDQSSNSKASITLNIRSK